MARTIRLLGLVITLLLWQLFAMGTLIDAAGAEFHFLAYAQHRANFDWFEFAKPLLLPYVAIAAWAIGISSTSRAGMAALAGLLGAAVFALIGMREWSHALVNFLLNGPIMGCLAMAIQRLARQLTSAEIAVAAALPAVASFVTIAHRGNAQVLASGSLLLLVSAQIVSVCGAAVIASGRRA